MKLRPAIAPVAHGGNLAQALARFGGEAHEWLDLSSAVSPWSWLAERAMACPADAAHHLPGSQPELMRQLAQAVCHYYGHSGLAVAGSQAAIRALPACFEAGDVWVLAGTYGEHEAAWRRCGHRVTALSAEAVRERFQLGGALPHMLVLVNPGNPGGEHFAVEECLHWAGQLAASGGWLLVDEAFMDLSPQASLLQHPRPANLLVLRSPGKFFGLAGLRAGFVFAPGEVLEVLAGQLGPWTVSGPACFWLAQALTDDDWITNQRRRLHEAAERQAGWLPASVSVQRSDLFFTLKTAQAQHWHAVLAQHKIWTRLFAGQNLLRLGLVADDAQGARLQRALASLSGE